MLRLPLGGLWSARAAMLSTAHSVKASGDGSFRSMNASAVKRERGQKFDTVSRPLRT